jgi:transcriptional regulator with XRE-family HTH domain
MGRKKKVGRPRARTNAFGQWIDAQGLHRDDVARKLGISRRMLDRLCAGDRHPGLKVAVAVEDMTEGEVSVRSWLRYSRRPRTT